jgi:hypothetical protein
MGYARAAIVVALCLSLFASTSLLADNPEQTALADAWKAFYGENLEKAGQIAEKLTKSKDEGVRVEAMHLVARVLWQTGQPKQREKAIQVWKGLEKASTLNANIKRQSIAKALQLAAGDDIEGAVRELAGLLNNPYPDTCTLEGALLIAELRNGQGDNEKAKRACDFVDFYASKLKKGNELSESAIKPFLDAADAIRQRAGKSEAE